MQNLQLFANYGRGGERVREASSPEARFASCSPCAHMATVNRRWALARVRTPRRRGRSSARYRPLKRPSPKHAPDQWRLKERWIWKFRGGLCQRAEVGLHRHCASLRLKEPAPGTRARSLSSPSPASPAQPPARNPHLLRMTAPCSESFVCRGVTPALQWRST